jgi:hypothetical protein
MTAARMLRLLSIAVTAGWMIVQAGSPRPARACTPGCAGVLQLPRGASLPADRLYLRSLRSAGERAAIVRADGTPVAASYKMVGGDLVFGADEPVAVGERLRFTYAGCSSGEEDRTAELTVAPAAPFPTSVGVLRVDSVGTRSTASGETMAAVRLALDPAPSANAAWTAADLRLEIDGTTVLADAPGNFIGRVPPAFELGALCGAAAPPAGAAARDECGRAALNWLTPGKHRVSISGHPAGATVDPPPASVEIDLRCPAPAAGGCVVATRGAPERPGLLLAVLAVVSVAARRRCSKTRGASA